MVAAVTKQSPCKRKCLVDVRPSCTSHFRTWLKEGVLNAKPSHLGDTSKMKPSNLHFFLYLIKLFSLSSLILLLPQIKTESKEKNKTIKASQESWFCFWERESCIWLEFGVTLMITSAFIQPFNLSLLLLESEWPCAQMNWECMVLSVQGTISSAKSGQIM